MVGSRVICGDLTCSGSRAVAHAVCGWAATDKENAALLMCNIVHILRLLGLRSTQSDFAEAASKAARAASPKRVAKSTAPASELVKAALMPSVGAAALFDTAVTLCTRAYNSLSKKKCVAGCFILRGGATGACISYMRVAPGMAPCGGV